MDRVNIMVVTTGDPDRGKFTVPRKFYIDCPLDVEMNDPELRRIEIPRELAAYIDRIQIENENMRLELRERREENG